MKFDLVLKYNTTLFLLKKRLFIKKINMYSFYIYIFWDVQFFSGLKKLKRGKFRYDAFIGQIVGLRPKFLGLGLLNYGFIEGVEIFRLVYIKSKALIKSYEVRTLKKTFFVKTKKKQRYVNIKKFIKF